MRLSKVGAADWTVSKVIKIVILVVVMVVVIFAFSTNAIGSVDKVKGIADNFIDMINFFSGNANVDCEEISASKLYGGEDFLKLMGLEGKNVIVKRCSGYCEISGDGMASYQVGEGFFQRLDLSGDWQDWDYLVSVSTGDAEKNWELYHKGMELMRSVPYDFDPLGEGPDFFEGDFSTKKFILYGEPSIVDKAVVAEWEDGVWVVKEGSRDDNFVFLDYCNYDQCTCIVNGIEYSAEDLKEVGRNEYENLEYCEKVKGRWKEYVEFQGAYYSYDKRKIVYEGKDDDAALGVFYDYVKDWASSDDVYWKVLEHGGIYDEDTDKGEVIGTFLTGDIYRGDAYFNAFLSIETACYDNVINGLKPNCGWIRTQVTGSSSSAYGPVQITMGLADACLHKTDPVKCKTIEWTEEEKKYLEEFVKQGCLFLLHGDDGYPRKSSTCAAAYKEFGFDGDYRDEAKYGYGGSGHLTSSEDKRLYLQIAEKMIEDVLNRNGGASTAIAREWFGSTSEAEMNHYATKYNEALERLKNYNDAHSVKSVEETEEKIDDKITFEALKAKFENQKYRLADKAVLSDDKVALLKNAVEGKSVEVNGVKYDADVEVDGPDVFVTFSSGDEKYGLRYVYSLSDSVEILDGKNTVYDGNNFILVFYEDVGAGHGAWVSVGDDRSYRLPQNEFLDSYHSALIKGFLRGACGYG